ncbi:uncharacterized protein LOC124166299 isoform X2 [Ischnura elegans]|uniref:uncharacterized protein LOC124166299 isoform X2 n=1 Tax=Ischnura elegans TaxID=197161 RepID=UPI001ED86B7D|nr:uncharacterized protein LOC124166299 isoform X2 [Ischnura elegans]
MASMPSPSSEMSVICRCCLEEKDDLISLLKVVSETIPLNYAAVVKKCVGLEIAVENGLPSQICSSCSDEAERFYKFKNMCLSSEQKLRPTATLELVLNEVACQTDECHQTEEEGKNLKDVEKEDNSKDGSCEDLNSSLSVEIKDVGLPGDQSTNKTLVNPSDLTLSEESILSVLDMGKNKVSDVLEENELPSLSSPVSDGDFSSWLEENQEEIKESGEFGEQENSLCEGEKGSKDENLLIQVNSGKATPGDEQNDGDGKDVEKQDTENLRGENVKIDSSLCEGDESVEEGNLLNSLSSDNATSDDKINDSKEKEDEMLDIEKDSSEKESEKSTTNLNVEQGEKIEISDDPMAKSISESVSENVRPCVEGRVTVKSLEDLTYDPNSIPQIPVTPSGTSITALEKSEFSETEEVNKVSLIESEAAEKSEMIPSSSTHCDAKLLSPVVLQNAGEGDSSKTEGKSMDSLSKENNDCSTLVKSPSVNETNVAGEKSILEEALSKSLTLSGKADDCVETIPNNNRKRLGEEASSDVNIAEGTCGPSMKKPRIVEECQGSTKDVHMKDEDNEITSSEQTTSIEDGKREVASANDGGTVESVEMNSSQKDKVQNEAGEPETFSDDDMMGDDGGTFYSSGSEYVPVDSPALSDESSRPLRPRTRPKTGGKHGAKKLGLQGFSIRECRVVLSDIARPGSSALTNSNSMSSHVSVSSLKSIENDEDTVKNTEKEDGGKEADGISENTSSCTAWIKVEPEDMEEMEGEADEGNNLASEEVDSGTMAQGMPSSTDINAETTQGAKHTIPSYTYPPPQGVLVANLKSSIMKRPMPVPAPQNKSVQRYPCRLCPRVFSSMNGLKGHKRAHKNHSIKVPVAIKNPVEPKVEQNVCKICGMSFPNALYLKSHMVCHTIVRPNSGKVNSIELPGSSSGAEESPQKAGNLKPVPEESINVMEPTVLIHESPSAFGDSPYQYNQPSMVMQNVCSVCSQIFPTQEKLLRHQVLANHNKTWNCEECPAMFANSIQLQNHVLSQHPVKRTFVKKEHKCNICGKVFSRSSRLNQHMSTYHLTAPVAPITCQLCGKYFASIEQLNMHKKEHEIAPPRGINSDLSCSVCRRVFSKRSRLKRHMILHESQSFPCSQCPKTFISEELLTEHQLHHTQNVAPSPISSPAAVPQSPAEPTEDVSGGIPCTACGRIFTNRARLKQHVVVHTKSGFVACQNCFKVFANGQMLEMHAAVCVKTEEGSNGSQSNVSSKSASIPHLSSFVSCTSCGKAFPSKELLTEHEKTCVGLTVVKKLDGTWKVMENADERPRGSSISSSSSNSSRSVQQNTIKDTMGETKTYSCKVCAKSFTNYHGLNSHMRFHQENAATYKCELCSKMFPSRNKLTQHMSSHSAVYRCGICSQAFGLVDELKKHVSQCVAAQKGGGSTPSNYFHCTGCSEVFSLLEQLAAHIKCHADEFPHACHECYKVFANQVQLNRHMSSHGNQNPARNVCKICNKSFSNYASLEKHIVVHTGEKKFECPYCMQRFSQRSSLHRHKLTQHETKM